MLQKIKDLINQKGIASNIIIVIGIFIILPFIILSFYNQPSADDYCFAFSSRDSGVWTAFKNCYSELTGRYFANFLLLNNPLVYKTLWLYKFSSIVMLVLTMSAFYFLINSIGYNFLSLRSKLAGTLALQSLYLAGMPEVAQGYYWMNGSITYQLASILFVFFTGFYIRIFRTNKTGKKLFYLPVAILLLFLVIGCNEVSMAMVVSMLFLIAFIHFIITKKPDIIQVVFAVVAFLFSLIVIFAPGNTVRSGFFVKTHSTVYYVTASVAAMILYISKWSIETPVMVITLLFLLFGSRVSDYFIKRNVKMFNVHPLFVVFAGCTILSFLFFVGFWSLGSRPPERTINVMYFAFIPGWFYFIQVLMVFLKKKFNYSIHSLPIYVRVFVGLAVIFYTVRPLNNIENAYVDLFTLRAYNYDKEVKQQYHFLENDSCALCTLKKLEYKPYTLFTYDIESDSSFYINNCMSAYFKKKRIKVAE